MLSAQFGTGSVSVGESLEKIALETPAIAESRQCLNQIIDCRARILNFVSTCLIQKYGILPSEVLGPAESVPAATTSRASRLIANFTAALGITAKTGGWLHLTATCSQRVVLQCSTCFECDEA